VKDLAILQQEFEDNSLALGGKRFREALARNREKGTESTKGAAKKAMRECLRRVEAGITAMCERKGKGRRHLAVKVCKRVGYDVSAYMILKCVIDSLSARNNAKRVGLDVTGLMIDELRYRRFKAEAPKLFRYRMGKFNTSNYAHMKRSLDATLSWAKVDTTDIDSMLTQTQRALVGLKLLDILITTTNLVEVRHSRRRQGKRWVEMAAIYPTAATLKWLEDRNNGLGELLPVRLPMVLPPADWGPGVRGGYRYALAGKSHIVRQSREASYGDYDRAEMPTVYEALNAVQATPWRINLAVYDLIAAIRERGEALAGLPAFEEEELPKKPDDIATNEEAKQTWKRAAYFVHERNHVRRQKALVFQKVLGVAERVKSLNAFWFPMNLDFRGRMYPLSSYLSPQGDDVSRGLLTFAEGKPLGERGATALAIHGANVMGEWDGVKLDKLSLQERVNWVAQHKNEIVSAAEAPFANRWWSEAEKPLQFFAFCVEWKKFLAEGVNCISSLPCAMDGSCNGVQHFSAMLRDPVGGKSVNLLPSDRPHDLYQDVADQVQAQLERRFRERMSQRWIKSGLVNRKLCKRGTMTFGYGSKKFGFRKQLLEDFDLVAAFGDRGVANKHAGFMASLIWDALNSTVVAAGEMMDWLQVVGRAVVKKTRQPLRWSAPTGFPIMQRYYRTDLQRITTILAGHVFMPAMHLEDESRVNVAKQTNAIAPNFVHSLDAAALMYTVTCARSAGITCFGMVHDSYATTAGDYWKLNASARESFAWMYEEHDIIGTFYSELVEQAPEDFEVEAPPDVGTLDIGLVRDSDYFFS
jgi:DNA-directed RNA polymerase